jgi:hypothetical protein
MKFRFMTFIASLYFFLNLSCNNKDILRHSIQGSEYFPNTIGNYWEYDVYDSSNYREHPNIPRLYNVKVKISGQANIADGGVALIWEYQYPWGIEKKYVKYRSDTLAIYDSIRAFNLSYLQYPNDLFILPFSINNDWKSNLLWSDSFFVRKDTSPLYQNSFLIKREYFGQQAFFYNKYWFKPNVGFEKIQFDETTQGIRRNEIWQLKYYNLK